MNAVVVGRGFEQQAAERKPGVWTGASSWMHWYTRTGSCPLTHSRLGHARVYCGNFQEERGATLALWHHQ